MKNEIIKIKYKYVREKNADNFYYKKNNTKKNIVPEQILL